MTGHGDFSTFTEAEISRLRGKPEGSFELRDYREHLRRRSFYGTDSYRTDSKNRERDGD